MQVVGNSGIIGGALSFTGSSLLLWRFGDAEFTIVPGQAALDIGYNTGVH